MQEYVMKMIIFFSQSNKENMEKKTRAKNYIIQAALDAKNTHRNFRGARKNNACCLRLYQAIKAANDLVWVNQRFHRRLFCPFSYAGR